MIYLEKPIRDEFLMHCGFITYFSEEELSSEKILLRADILRSFWSPNDVCEAIFMTAPKDIEFVREKKLIALNNDGFGNIFMISDDGKIYYWDHEIGWSGKDPERFSFSLYSDSIDDFLAEEEG